MGKAKGNTLEGSRHVASLLVTHHSCVSNRDMHKQGQADRLTHRSMNAAGDDSTRCLSLLAKQTNAYHYSIDACKWGRCMMIW